MSTRIVNIIGGLGNQMFQFALYKSLRHLFPNDEILVNLHCFRGYKRHNGYELKRIFNINAPKATLRQIAQVAWPYPNYVLWKYGKHILPARNAMCVEGKNYDATIFSKLGDCYYDGYWQHEEYFQVVRQEILNSFNFPDLSQRNSIVAQQIKNSNSISIHIRRGDYLLTPKMQGICTLDYYTKAISYAKEKLNPNLYCIFSDDIQWCRQNIQPLIMDEEVLFVDWNKGKESFVDMHLMSMCKHNIIANSSFSWWGAWLNQNENKIVIGPKLWEVSDDIESPMCRNWIRL